MNSDVRRAIGGGVLGVGLLLLAIGLFLGFGGISKGGVSCGSAFKPDKHAARVSDLTSAIEADNGMMGGSMSHADDCADATSNRKPIAWALTAPGGVLAFLGVIILAADAQAQRDARLSEENA